ncbi:hypothetical protein DPMN_046912 [Dreissena polymorpha]|uniref:N-acylglucosamine 2-epimerase n=1 Tax=Dreissena polymorpha TaxID=45954 RepID=A0A9D4I117_DREPO|nr:hypothetical protein DPMN_046912 [Dreissena polymorpha]
MAEKRLQEFYDEISEDLTRCVQFWLTHSHDDKYGGFFNCIDEDGTVYDETKHVWLQARQVWIYAKLYNEEEQFNTQAVLQAAEKDRGNPNDGQTHSLGTRGRHGHPTRASAAGW